MDLTIQERLKDLRVERGLTRYPSEKASVVLQWSRVQRLFHPN